jgi:GDP-L-fucose synthase
MPKLNIFLTGGGGFIGRNFLEQLGQKCEISAPSHKDLDLLDAEAVKSFLQAGKFDIVVHAANFGGNRAQSGITGVLEANKNMFLNLAENSNLFGRTIFLGSGAEYGKQMPIIKVKETDFGQNKPEDEYGKAKYFASEYIASSQNIINFRVFGVFGKYEDYRIRFISNAITRVLFNMPIIIRQNVKFDYIYVNDLVRIIEYFIEHQPKEKFYNVGGSKSVELLELAEIIKTVTGSKDEIKVLIPGLNREYTCNNSLLVQELKDFKFTSYETAIGEMVEWYKQNKNSIDQSKLNFDA